MERVVVGVRNVDDSTQKDIEVPTDVRASELARAIAIALGWDRSTEGSELIHSIHVEPLGRVLSPQETLSDASVWDGSTLNLESVYAAYLEGVDSQHGYRLHRAKMVLGRGIPTEKTDDRTGYINLEHEQGAQFVSRPHASLLCTKGQWQLIHQSTRNGTWLNGRQLDESDRLTVHDGDRIELAGVNLIFRLGFLPDSSVPESEQA